MFVPNTGRLSGHFTSLNPNLCRSQAKVYMFLAITWHGRFLSLLRRFRDQVFVFSSWKNTVFQLIHSNRLSIYVMLKGCF